VKTSAKDFALFQAECERWQQRLSLGDWEFRCQHDACTGLAGVMTLVENKLACFTLNTVWDTDPVSNDALKAVAKHEVLHVLLAELEDLGRSRVNTPALANQIEHAIIRRLEKVL
jgi:hypothetical protein